MAEIAENRGDTANQYLSFYIKDEMFAISVSYVKEIIQYIQVTRVPMMQSFILGVTNIRGNVIPVIDLSDRLSLGKSGVDKKTCIITIETLLANEELEIGIVVDVVDQVYNVNESDLLDAPEFGSKIKKEFIKMIAKIDDKFITILNMDIVLDINELSRTLINRVA